MTNDEIMQKVNSLNIHKKRLMVYLKNHLPDVYEAVLQNTSFLDATYTAKNEITFAERLYCVRNNLSERKTCCVCGKYVSFNTDICEYRKTCSISCSRKTKETLDKFRTTLASKDDPLNTKRARETRYSKNGGKWHADDFVQKTQNTIAERHGDSHWNNPEQTRQTCMTKYGVDHPMKDKRVKAKLIERIFKKYGVNSVFELDENRAATSLGIRKRAWQYILASPDVVPVVSENAFMEIDDINADDSVTFKCKKCGKEFTSYWDNGHARPCPHCSSFGHGMSNQEKQLVEFLLGILPNGYNLYTRNKINRQIIAPKELDIVITDSSGNAVIAVEYDGLYWHGETMKSSTDAQLEKTEKCEEHGIQLIHVFENEWVSRTDIVKSRFRNMFGNYDKTVYARKCEVKEVISSEAEEFLNLNHIQGSVRSSVLIGLYDKSDLISIMTFSKCRFSKNCEWELVRFCNKLGYHVPGAASKLLRYFERTYNPVSIISYADRRWSRGKLYHALGFELSHTSRPNYWYFKPHDTARIFSRMRFQKHKLPKLLESFDMSKSEVENMRANGYSRIFDCGNLVFVKRYAPAEKK